MSDELKKQARELSEKLAVGEAALREGKAKLKAMILAGGKAGTAGTKDFNDEVEEASKPIDTLAEEVEETRRSWGIVISQLGEGTPQGERPLQAAPAAGAEGTWGDRFIASEPYKALLASRRLDQRDTPIGQTDAVQMTKGVAEVKALLTSTSYPLVPDRQLDVVRLPLETVTILDLISIGTTTTEIVEWVRQVTRDNAAASVAEGVEAAESTFAWEEVQAQVQEIAHFHASTKRAMRDEGQLRSLVDQEMIEGLRVKLQSLIISGGLAATDFEGLYNTEDIGSYEMTDADIYLADAIHRAITTIRIATLGGDEPTAVGIHPNDWEAHRLAKDDINRYINGDPSTTGPATMWGLKPVVHTAFPEGNPLVGNYKRAKLWIWSDVSLSMTDSHEDFFTKRLVAVMASFGGALGVLQPESFCEVVTETS